MTDPQPYGLVLRARTTAQALADAITRAVTVPLSTAEEQHPTYVSAPGIGAATMFQLAPAEVVHAHDMRAVPMLAGDIDFGHADVRFFVHAERTEVIAKFFCVRAPSNRQNTAAQEGYAWVAGLVCRTRACLSEAGIAESQVNILDERGIELGESLGTQTDDRSTTAPGWYPDPIDASLQRYWDGVQWTAHSAPAATMHRSAHHKRQDATIRVQTRLSYERLAAISVEITRDIVGKPTFNQLASWTVRHIDNDGSNLIFGVFKRALLGQATAHRPFMTFYLKITAFEWGCQAETGIDDFETSREVVNFIPMPKQLLGYAGYKLYMVTFRAAVLAHDPSAQVQIVE